MALPINCQVEATPNFLANLQNAYDFFVQQDVESAGAQLKKLKADLREMVAILAWSPASGRPARFLAAKSAQAHLKNDTVLRLAREAGLPNLREFIVGKHIVLYAHSETNAVLLALKHQRQLMYSVDY